jgi:DNA-binding protein YbaB
MVFDKVRQARELKRMRDQAKAIQRDLAQIGVVVEKGDTKVRVSADQKVRSIEINGVEQKNLVGLLNKALDKAQKKAARRMQGMMGDLSGLLGG